ncbi:MAG TPA: hypothetical protein VD766_04925 [Solirubrobacterales bacterium]|nr:hypothetical protein [Solirubrobacterales bacterium]
MNPASSRSEWVTGTAAVAAGLGVLMFALFPLALPFVILTIVATLPLVLPLVGLAAVAVAWLGIRSAGRGVRGFERPRRKSQLKRARAFPDCG